MPGKRSRQGCEECRRRRRKCDEEKPNCGPCNAFGRPCNYTLRLIWGVSEHRRRAAVGRWRLPMTALTEGTVSVSDCGNENPPDAAASSSSSSSSHQQTLSLPQQLPNGVPLPPRYRELLSYFTENILASLSCHPAIHEDLCRGLIPVALDSPHLLSACLTLAAAGFLSRGLSEIGGVEISRVLGHLQHSGLALLRSALDSGGGQGQQRRSFSGETLLATCLIWCLADVFACGQGGGSLPSWRIHLQGIKALIDGNRSYWDFGTGSEGVSRASMRHLYLLYLSLRTLPYVPSPPPPPTLGHPGSSRQGRRETALDPSHAADGMSPVRTSIDGFLGYSEELLHVLQQVNAISSRVDDGAGVGNNDGSADNVEGSIISQSDMLLGKLAGMIRRDASTPPSVASIRTAALSDRHGREFLLCHRTFQQATLVHLYRRLYRLPSGSRRVRAAVAEMEATAGEMTQGRPCHAWVAMAMPLFTMGCEAFTPEQRRRVLDKVDRFEACLGSLHVGVIRRALEDIWRARMARGDVDGRLCAGQLLGEQASSISSSPCCSRAQLSVSSKFQAN
ncbi:hypothetical protein JDV02_007328 [Purpureocillium takamizusanense]|uniref:Zn(2)-C6 fungal-type domain-containing protein n=1 Tax=Purpureocillium takamizusanense TaxID=2060973 RepID=A0A9Q8QMA2_9HYPO|nr:uncharacterized protein JDV02_007328 [Purpureocillium takamizusanense]UNI21329.1 hypothetical protein JDV02_007328 [Purpureocillium takamizusanense]